MRQQDFKLKNMGIKNIFKKKPKRTLSEVIANHLRLRGFKIEEDQFSDGSSRWVALMKNGFTLTISFDMKGNVIKDIELHKDIYEVVDQKKLF